MSSEASAGRKYGGMTVNERLFEAGLLDAFDRAVRAADRAKIVEILIKVEIDAPEAARTADSILKHPTRYGRI